jgi:single-strand DNA-binding protein
VTIPPEHENAVTLVGRVAASAEERVLPSGDLLVTFRLVVERPRPSASARDGARAGVDTIDCSVWSAGLRRQALAWGPGDVVQLRGALRRRFWRAAAGTVSRSEVEVAAAKRLSKASREAGGDVKPRRRRGDA